MQRFHYYYRPSSYTDRKQLLRFTICWQNFLTSRRPIIWLLCRMVRWVRWRWLITRPSIKPFWRSKRRTCFIKTYTRSKDTYTTPGITRLLPCLTTISISVIVWYFYFLNFNKWMEQLTFLHWLSGVFTARCIIVQSAVLRLHVVRLSVYLSVTLSVRL